MEIPGIATFNGQPALTNPSTTESQLVGRQTAAQQNSATIETTVIAEQSPANVVTSSVVNQAENIETAGFNPQNPGSTIDFTV